MTCNPIKVAAFYKFIALSAERVEALKSALYEEARRNNVRGLCLLADEGINATVAGTPGELDRFVEFIRAQAEFLELEVKYSACAKSPFRRFKVDLRREIVTSGEPQLKPWEHRAKKLSPQEWETALRKDDDVVVIDTRNVYETKLGVFRGARDPMTRNFGEFKPYVAGLDLPKSQKILIYCTGGIRCEKAALILEQHGYENVFQLEGGILKYLEQYPDSQFLGECFVFDHRVAVGQRLEPSKRYGLCAHCGEPASTLLRCDNCGSPSVVCEECLGFAPRRSCSKNCAYHLERRKAGAQA